MWLAISGAVAIVACAIAVVTDLRSLRIPNRLTVATLACGLAFALVGGIAHDRPLAWLASSLAGALVGLVVFGAPAAVGLVGMGDVKLAAAVGAWLHWPLALAFVLYAAIAGGIIAITYAVYRRRLGAVVRNVVGAGDGRLHHMPYALAIALGCAWAVASRHVDALRLV